MCLPYDKSETGCVVVAHYPLRNSDVLSLWKAMSASGNISASFALQDSDVLPRFLTINIRSIHGSVEATWKYVITSFLTNKHNKIYKHSLQKCRQTLITANWQWKCVTISIPRLLSTDCRCRICILSVSGGEGKPKCVYDRWTWDVFCSKMNKRHKTQ